MLPLVCESCDTENTPNAHVCQHCGCPHFKAPELTAYDPDSCMGILTRLSLGQDQIFRKFSSAIVALGVAVLLYGMALQRFYGNEIIDKSSPWLWFVIGSLGLREIWAFFNGRTTFIDRFTLEPKQENTGWRCIGLLFDVVIVCISCRILYDV